MKVLYSKDLANHASPEPHGDCGNTMAEALVGESAGGQLSSEITYIRVPTLLSEREGYTKVHSDIASYGRTRRSLRTWHVWMPCARESGDPRGTHHIQAGIGESRRQKSPAHRGWLCFDESNNRKNRVHMEWWAGKGLVPHSRSKKPFGSRTRHSTVEAGEQEDMSTSAESVEGRK